MMGPEEKQDQDGRHQREFGGSRPAPGTLGILVSALEHHRRQVPIDGDQDHSATFADWPL